MATHILTTRDKSRPGHGWEEFGAAGEREDEGVLSARGAAGAAAVAVAAILLAAAPVAVAIVAIVSPGDLDRVFGWLSGVSVAFAVVAAGRVPAAAFLALALARGRS